MININQCRFGWYQCSLDHTGKATIPDNYTTWIWCKIFLAWPAPWIVFSTEDNTSMHLLHLYLEKYRILDWVGCLYRDDLLLYLTARGQNVNRLMWLPCIVNSLWPMSYNVLMYYTYCCINLVDEPSSLIMSLGCRV